MCRMFRIPQLAIRNSKSPGRRNRTFVSRFKAGRPAADRSPMADVRGQETGDRRHQARLFPVSCLLNQVPCGNRTRLACLEGRSLSRSAKGTNTYLRSCGGRNRTCDEALNRRPPVPTRAPPQWRGGRGQNTGNRRPWPSLPVRCLLFPVPFSPKSTRRELNPHLRRGIAVRCRYITGAQKRAELSKTVSREHSEHRARIELALPHDHRFASVPSAESWPLDHQCFFVRCQLSVVS